MAPKRRGGPAGARGRAGGGSNGSTKRNKTRRAPAADVSGQVISSDEEGPREASAVVDQEAAAAADADEAEKTIPNKLLTRILHDFFAKDTTRISSAANAATAKYVDVFVREAIARAAVDKKGGFLEASTGPLFPCIRHTTTARRC